MDIRENKMGRRLTQLVYKVWFGIALNAALLSPVVNASPEIQLNQSQQQPSIEVLALSRGQGVPESSASAFQEIMALANSALECGQAVSVKKETIGLEGETRLCIVFKDDQAFADLGKQIRALAMNIDLLQVNDNRCSGN